MKRSRKTNRVSWAPGVNLYQVKLFLKEDCPSKVGGEHQDTLQAKTSLALQPSGIYDNDLPPGFEGGYHTGRFKCDLAKIRIQWKSPPKFALNFNWHVVAGEESKEDETQKLREKRVLEAVYPRLSVIPPNPVFLDVEVECYDDTQIPLVPLTPIEDEEGAELCSGVAAQANSPSNFETPALLIPPGLSNTGTPNIPHCLSSAAEGSISGASSDMMSAALTTIMKNKKQGSLVDTDLLVKILSDPKMVEKLIHNHRHPSAADDDNLISASSFFPEPGVTSLPCSKPATIPSSMPAAKSNHLVKEFQPALRTPVSNPIPVRVETSLFPIPSTNINMLSGYGVASAANSTMNQVQPDLSVVPMQPVIPIISTTAMQTIEVNTVKDATYFKNLIREHGREMEEAKISPTGSHLIHIQNLKPETSKIKFRKSCIFITVQRVVGRGRIAPTCMITNHYSGKLRVLRE